MPDNWAFVFAAYGLTAAVLTLYWRRLVRKEKELQRRAPGIGSRLTTTATEPGSARNVAGSITAHTERARGSSTADREIAERSREIGERSRHPSSSGHPRSDPTTRGPLQS